MPKCKKQQGRNGWDTLPWSSVKVKEGDLGEADDCFAFTIEEVDGSQYVMEKDALGGFSVKGHGGGGSGGVSDMPVAGGKGAMAAAVIASVMKQTQKKEKPTKKSKARKKEKEEEEQELELGEGPGEAKVMEIEYETVSSRRPPGKATSGTTRVIEARKKEMEANEEEGDAQAKQPKKKKRKRDKKPATAAPATPTLPPPTPQTPLVEIKAQLSHWSPEALSGVSLHPLLLRNLHRQGFYTPTPIQRRALPLAMLGGGGGGGGGGGKDLMGAAETGSGKTLAYGLPILDYLLKRREEKKEGEEDGDEKEGEAGNKYEALAALILCPTRELALQVTEHLQEMLVGDTAPGRARLNVVGIVGGLSDTKQARLLQRRPEVVVATVGRCWEMIKNGQEGHLREMGRLRFLVLDEADRMVEQGHFPEMQSLLTRVVEQGKTYQRDYDGMRRMKREGEKKAKLLLQQQGRKKKRLKEEEDEEEGEEGGEEEEGEEEEEVDLCEIPTKSLKDILEDARRLGLKGLHGLEELDADDKEEEEELDADDDDDEEEEEEGAEDDDILIEGNVDSMDEEEDEEEGEEGQEEEEMDVHDDEEEQAENEEANGVEKKSTLASVLRALPPPVTRQTLIFSATLVMPEEMREGKGGKKGGKKQQKKGKGGKDDKDVMARIMREVGMQGAPAIIDLTCGVAKQHDAEAAGAAASVVVAADVQPLPFPTTPRTATAATASAPSLALPTGLQLSHVKSVGGQKDAHLYYFLRRYPGRTIIFTNSIDQTRRLAQILSLLRLPAKALHAKMQQRARLKSLDYFRSQQAAVLVATDVAARGLDIPLVEHVIHYDLPRSLEVFVHRAGRTARANRKGLSFSLVAPRDERMHAEVCRALLSAPTAEEDEEEGGGEGEEQGQLLSMTTFPVDLQELNGARERVHLAGKIVGYEQEAGRQQASQSWFLKRAREADLELDEDLLEETEAGTEKERQRGRQMGLDRERLNELLSAPLVQQRRKFINVAEKLQGLKQAEGCKDAMQVVARTAGAAKAARRKDRRNRKGGSGGT